MFKRISTEIRQAAGAPAAAFLYAGCTLRKVSHDFAPLRWAQLRPAANFLYRAVTADTDPLKEPVYVPPPPDA